MAKVRSSILSCIVLVLFYRSCDGKQYTFGEDQPGSFVAIQKEGFMSLLEKHKDIPLAAPTCSKIVHVTVDIDNPLASPHVSYNKDVSTVYIEYNLLESSHSHYKITAKTVRLPICQDIVNPTNVIFVRSQG